VAFSWNGEKQDNFDIYIKLIGSSNYVRLTTDPADDISTAFSPDGQSIGFVRISKGHATFFVIPAIGGPGRVVAEIAIPSSDVQVYGLGPSFGWLPNSKWVVTEGLMLLSIESGETRSLTIPPTKSLADYSPALSPDGRTIAFSRWATSGLSDRCFRHQLLLGRQKHSSSSHTDRRSRVEEREEDILRRQKRNARLEDLPKRQPSSG
jgi:Tol biopolymer transport system component